MGNQTARNTTENLSICKLRQPSINVPCNRFMERKWLVLKEGRGEFFEKEICPVGRSYLEIFYEKNPNYYYNNRNNGNENTIYIHRPQISKKAS